MNQTNKLEYQSAVLSYANIEGWKSPFALTLTLRQARQTEPGYKELLTPDRASANFLHFMNILNKRVFGKAFTKFGTRLQVFSVLEGGPDKRLHFHAAIECPRDEIAFTFPSMIREAWLRTDWGYNQIKIKSDADNGWIDYISKFRDKPSYVDGIDWTNCHIAN
jgi:hypothetical protein